MLIGIARLLWSSPTFTTWGKQGAEAIRMLAVTPLILTRFDTTEIAAWYLFASLLFFGHLLQGGVSRTFSRTISFGMAGASDLAPIKDLKVSNSKSGSPNWELVGRAYGTVGWLNLVLALCSGLLAAGMGYYGLERLVEGHTNPDEIWWAFGIFLISQTVIFVFRKYEIALRGMNYVPLINRWSALISLISVAVGAFVLAFGANIWQLALAMQGVLMLDVLRMRFLLRQVEGGRAKRFPARCLDRQVIGWAWPPLWKSLASNLSQEGVIQFALVLFARNGEAGVVASFLFSYRILRVIGRVSDAPFTSHGPKFSALLARGEVDHLKVLFLRQISRSQMLLAAGILIGGLVFTLGLPLIGSEIGFLDLRAWFCFGLIFLVYRLIVMTRGVFILGNTFPFLRLEVMSGTVAFLLVLIFVPSGNVWMMFSCSLLPLVMLMGTQVLCSCSKRLNLSVYAYLNRTAIKVIILYLLLAGLLISSITNPIVSLIQ